MFLIQRLAFLGFMAWFSGCGGEESDLRKSLPKSDPGRPRFSSLIAGVAEVERNPRLEKKPRTEQPAFADILNELQPPFPLHSGKDAGAHNDGTIDVREKLAALKKFIYETRGIRFDPDASSLEHVLPGEVWRRGVGSCLGISLIWLMLGEQWDVPLHGVLLPGHFFVRYDDDATRVNLEPNRSGYSYTDSEYRSKYAVPDSGWYDLGNLTTSEVLSAFHYALGNLYLKKDPNHIDAHIAIRHLERSVAYFPGYAEAMGNLALAYDGAGYGERALGMLYRTKALRGSFPRLYHNLGALLVKHERYREAVSEYRRGLSLHPQDVELLYGLAVSLFHGGNPDSAGVILERARKKNPRHPGLLSLAKALEQ